MYMKNYLRNRGIFILIILAVAILTAWLVRPQPVVENFHIEGTVIEITDGKLPIMLVELEDGDRTRLLVPEKAPELHSTLRLQGTCYADGNLLYQLSPPEASW